jgi:hypothetical protein
MPCALAKRRQSVSFCCILTTTLLPVAQQTGTSWIEQLRRGKNCQSLIVSQMAQPGSAPLRALKRPQGTEPIWLPWCFRSLVPRPVDGAHSSFPEVFECHGHVPSNPGT